MPDPYTVMHAGFHKTGAAGLHKILDRNEDALQKRGINAVHHRHMRKNFTAPCQQNAGGSRQTVMDDRKLRKVTGRFFDQVKKDGPDRLILTDQNIAGSIRPAIKTGQLYRHAGPIMKVVAQQIPFTVNEIHLVVRNYADFFTALYLDYIADLKRHDTDFVTPQAMCDAVFKRLSGWHDVVGPIRSQFPQSKIMLWRFEGFDQASGGMTPLLQHLVGDTIDATSLETGKRSKQGPAISNRAVAELGLLMKTDGAKVKRETLQAVLKAFPDDPPFDPWQDWERAHLDRLYGRDIVRLGTDKTITIMQPA